MESGLLNTLPTTPRELLLASSGGCQDRVPDGAGGASVETRVFTLADRVPGRARVDPVKTLRLNSLTVSQAPLPPFLSRDKAPRDPESPRRASRCCQGRAACAPTAPRRAGAEGAGRGRARRALVAFHYSPCLGATETRREAWPPERSDPACETTAALTPPCRAPSSEASSMECHFQSVAGRGHTPDATAEEGQTAGSAGSAELSSACGGSPPPSGGLGEGARGAFQA